MKVLNLSGIDGVADYHLPAKLKDAMCLVKTDLGNIELRVSSHLINSAEVMDYERQLKKTNTEFKLVPSNIAEIVELNQQSGVTTQEQLNIIHGKIFEIFSAATDARSSDIHFRLRSKLCNVFFRVDGKLRFYKELTPEDGKSYINSLFNTRCEDRSHQSISYQEPCGAKVSEDFVQPLGLSGGRFASRPVADGGMVAVIRLISRRNEILSMEQLGLTDTEIETLERAIAKPTGVIFLTGPMGSGKSTLAQVVCELLTSRDPGIHLLTVENPVESPIKGAVQTSLGTGEEWWEAIKSMMRLDLNWILIGEVRDPLSASAAIEAAQTGHNVLTTIHTTFPIDTISRLKSLNVQSDLITDASLITCLVGQRLAPKLCPSCKQKYTDSSKSVAPVIKKIIDKHCDIDSIYLKNPQGCTECSGAGVKGRVGIFEVIEVDANFMDIYHSQGKIKAYEHWYINGGATLCTNTLRLVNTGEIDPVLSHKDVCNLDRDYLIFTDEVRAAAKVNREKINE
ncbi:putative type IV secretion system protein PilQ (plasmid) [Yersinia pseudotuberculosis IP 31758]|uniref:Putative type IV secretion system protein PilQ n=1 Tax=Yersinia pseudotuberculosis serotype O:1b (strain IP 31758) TaxID=349747 RepID=A0A0U1QTC3_YERP3|nr:MULTISPECIES: ATPase, T2SS/T4P/T4SS family [Yersinia pseudotuberculosis complex]ABS45632.1 putative type IV secretion system protein PilQ [Yersinia pseudotuberculosis IP 31758]